MNRLTEAVRSLILVSLIIAAGVALGFVSILVLDPGSL